VVENHIQQSQAEKTVMREEELGKRKGAEKHEFIFAF
jgi:hypothetical protein